ncbi:hypothetical protein C8R48DRAFT_810111 [Suillus tomentosus]|nr:hypothetical protein C8R48DRAFT_810111 [Suillus tomentosus]
MNIKMENTWRLVDVIWDTGELLVNEQPAPNTVLSDNKLFFLGRTTHINCPAMAQRSINYGNIPTSSRIFSSVVYATALFRPTWQTTMSTTPVNPLPTFAPPSHNMIIRSPAGCCQRTKFGGCTGFGIALASMICSCPAMLIAGFASKSMICRAITALWLVIYAVNVGTILMEAMRKYATSLNHAGLFQ